ncbi:restriction endonuclease subunit S [Trueperella bernardiae]|uniref:restriction endonuclease subunit S n=1 Tax=Trueperella bernardiae TaxID=59561 RepID=UPI0011AE27E9|nr:restriction endonuclease subunit S [Trueperella bernardiae]
MPEERNVPQIRFKGFTDPWEQRQFRNLAQRLSTAVIGNILPAVEYQDLVSGTGELKTDYRSLLRGKTGVFFSPGDVLYGKLRPYLHNWFLPGFEGVAVGDFWVLRPQEVDSEFLYRLVQSEEFDKIANQSSGTKMPRADWNLVGQSEFRVARSGTEQEKIGVVFSALDRLISLHQRKLDKLTNVKKSLLEKMFPKPGSDVPEIRFAGFTAPWEQRQLGEVCTFRKGQGYSKADVSDKGTPILLYGRLYTHYQTCIRGIDTYADERADSVISRGGEVLVPASGESAEEIAVAASLDRPGVILGGDLNVATPSGVLKPEFLAYGITYGPAHQDLAMRAQGKSVVHVHNSDIAEVQICYPVPDEQNLFSTLFIRLDSLIALHQRKLDMLENVKKSLLEKMFV